MPDDILIQEKESVQDVTYKKDELYAPGRGAGLWFTQPIADSSFLAPWGTARRDWDLRNLARSMYNGLFISGLNNLANEIASTPWQLYGQRNQNYFHDLLNAAHFGEGWRSFCKRVVYGRGVYDLGVPVELIGKGDFDKPVNGRIEGISVLDPLYAETTGNVDYPIIYRSLKGYHRMHRTRVYRFVDNPQLDRDYYGRGMSALSRYAGTAWVDILMGKYQVEKLSDLPPAGIAILNNIAGKWKDIVAQYEQARRADGQSVWRNMMDVEQFDRKEKASIDFTSFSQLPDQFDYDTLLRHHINLVALALGVDPQDIAPLSGGNLGTSAQSFVLDSKAQRKTPGLILAEIETFINLYVLPAYLEFRFTPHDAEGEKAEAETAQMWVNVANSCAWMTDEQKVTLVANKVSAIADVVTDKQGNIIFNDTDEPNTETDTGVDEPLNDTTLPGTDTNETEPGNDTTSTGSPDNMPDMNMPVQSGKEDKPEEEKTIRKSYSSTRADFEKQVSGLIDGMVSGDITRVKGGVMFRDALATYGQPAMLDGLADGGTAVDSLKGDDLKTFNSWKLEQSAYVASLLDQIFKDGYQPDGKSRAAIWANKSLNSIYQKGLLSADADGLYEWQYGGTVHHCKTCSGNVGHTKRLSEWHADGCLPGNSCLECGGWNCKCKLKRKRQKQFKTIVLNAA